MYVTANLQSTTGIPCGSKLVGWDDMFPRQSHADDSGLGKKQPIAGVWGLLGGLVKVPEC